MEEKILKLKFWLFLVITLLLSLIFIYSLPHWFIQHKSLENMQDADISDSL